MPVPLNRSHLRWGLPSLYRTHIAKVKFLGLGLPLTCMLSLIIYMAFRYKPHIFWSTAPFSMIFSAGLSWLHALSTQASEKSGWLFSLFGFSLFLAVALISSSCIACIFILLRGCILIVSKIDLTWPNQPGPCGTLWSSHYNNIKPERLADGVVLSVFYLPGAYLILVSLCSFSLIFNLQAACPLDLELSYRYINKLRRGVPSMYRTYNTKVKLLGLGLPLSCMLSLIIYMAFD